MTDRTPAPSGGPRRRAAGASVAAALCALQALVLVGLAAFYIVELVQGQGSDRMRVLMSAVLILVFAGLLVVLARTWWSGSTWAATPTVVWNGLLVVVALADLLPSGLTLEALGLVVLAGATILAALAALRAPRPTAG